MRVRMKIDVSGSRDGRAWPRRGETLDVPDDEGMRLCASGMAEPVGNVDSDVEKAIPESAHERQVTDGPVGDAALPDDGGHDPVVAGQKEQVALSASPENTDVAARTADGDEVHPDADRAETEKGAGQKPAAEPKPRRAPRAKAQGDSK
ncbi:hypothetical protein ABZ636_03955 [Streptomyces sp. NPDC007251]|uniref:hypothetical protein n=1 Tax=Streptomyces sp. NPDC007251 TaxID=3154483 RepID=UPI0034019B45